MEWPEAESGEVKVGYQVKVLQPEGDWVLEQLPREGTSLTEFKKG